MGLLLQKHFATGKLKNIFSILLRQYVDFLSDQLGLDYFLLPLGHYDSSEVKGFKLLESVFGDIESGNSIDLSEMGS